MELPLGKIPSGRLQTRWTTCFLCKRVGVSLVSTSQNGPVSTNQSDARIWSLLETIFSQMAEALISLKRQDLEKADLYRAVDLPTGSAITGFVTVSQLGGGTWPWLSVYILVLLGALLSIVRCCKRPEVLDIDVQDSLRVLEVNLAEKEISLKSRIRFREKLEVMSFDHGLLPSGDMRER